MQCLHELSEVQKTLFVTARYKAVIEARVKHSLVPSQIKSEQGQYNCKFNYERRLPKLIMHDRNPLPNGNITMHMIQQCQATVLVKFR